MCGFLRDQLNQPADLDYRLRNLCSNKLFAEEELNQTLRSFEMFREGGARVQLEEGRAPTLSEICVTVFLYGREEQRKQFFFSLTASTEECISEISKEWGLTEKHTLYKCDFFEYPVSALRRLKSPLSKQHVHAGDLLCLKPSKDLEVGEKLKFSLHVTERGIEAADSRYLQDLDVPKEITLNELKEILSDLLECDEPDRIRLREK